MANSNATMEKENIETNMKHKFSPKTSLNEKCEAFLKKKYSLKPCHVSLPKIGDAEHLDNIEQSSQDLNQSITVPCIENKVHSKTLKIKSFNRLKSNKTSRDLEKSVSTMLVQHNHNVSASSSVETVCHTSCYVALEKLAIPINRFNKHTNCGNISSKADCLVLKTSDDEYHSQPDNVEVDCNYKKIQKCSFEMKMPCSEGTLIHSESKSKVNQPDFNSSYQHSSDSFKESFISDSKLSTPTNSESEGNQNIEKSNSFLPGISSVSSINKGIPKRNSNLLMSTPAKRRRLSFSNSDFSKFGAGKDRETLDYKQSSEKTNESLSPGHCASKEAKESDDLKSCRKRNRKLLSSSSESSTVKNQSSFRGRKGAFSQGKHEKHRIKRYSPWPDSNSSGDSDSTVLNSRLATTNSYKQTLKKQKIELTTISPTLSNQTVLNVNVEKTSSVCKERNACFEMCDKSRSVFTSKYKSSNSSETEEIISDNSLSDTNKKGIPKRNSNLLMSTPAKRKRLSFSNSDFSKYDAGKDTETLDYKQSSEKTNESLSPGHCASKEAKESDDLKSCMKRNRKLLSSSSESSTEKHKQSKHSFRGKHIRTKRVHISNSSSESSTEKHKQSKHSFRGKHIRTKIVHISNTERKYINKCVSSEESAAPDVSNNSERGQACNRSFKYDLKPCCVYLVDAGKNDAISNTGNQFNDLHQKDSPKEICEIDCLESNSNKQICFSKGTKGSKSLKCIEKESFDDNKDTVKECIVDTDDVCEDEKGHIKKCSDYDNTNSVHELQDHSNESRHKTLDTQIKKLECYFSDSSNSLPCLDAVFRNSLFSKMECDNQDSLENDSFAENCKKTLNCKKVDSIISSRKCSSVNQENDKLEVKVICDDPDMDEAYLADTDEGSDNLESAPKNYNSVSADNCKSSADLSVNQVRNEIDDKILTKKIPYCYLGSKKNGAKNDGRFLFRSKTNGSVYIVDFFEYQNIEKMFVTIHWKKGTLLNSNNDSNRNSSPTLSERIEALGGFNKMDGNISPRTPATSGKNQHENKQKYPGKENLSSFDKGEVLNTKKISETLNTDCSKPGPSCSPISLSDDTTLSNTSSDHSENNKYDNFCVHCCVKFSTKRESYNHTCNGKLQRGYLCVYCEMVFSSYSKLQSHRALHFI